MTEAIKKNILRKQSSINKVSMVDEVPLFSFVELNINELCNRTCIFCPRHDPKEYPNQNLHMNLDLAELIANQLNDLGFDGVVNISGTGEATLTKHLVNIVKKFGDKNIHVEIVTNGDRLKPKLIKKLYSVGLKQLVVSMYDGPEQVDYFDSLFKDCGIQKELYTLRGEDCVEANKLNNLLNCGVNFAVNPKYFKRMISNIKSNELFTIFNCIKLLVLN